MVDFRKRLSNKKVEAVIDPVKLYDTLDRAYDKGPLRPAQIAVLEEWFSCPGYLDYPFQNKRFVYGLLLLPTTSNLLKDPCLLN